MPKGRRNENDDDDDIEDTVIVIGAGISGLAAAKKLQERGYRVIVLEAQGIAGGRLRTNRTIPGITFDEGASWIHGINPSNPIVELANDAGMTTIKSNNNSVVVYDVGGREVKDRKYDNTEKQFYNLLENMVSKGDTNKSFLEVFQSLHPEKLDDRLWKFFLSTYLTFDTGDLDKLSSRLYDEGEESKGGEKIVTNGYDTIAKYLANGLDISFRQRVTKIDYSNDIIKVFHTDGITKANHVIVTVPLGVLKSNQIEFTPELPLSKQTAIEKIGMNCVNKFLLIWDESCRRFWDKELFIFSTPEMMDQFNYFVNINKINSKIKALMTFAFAEAGRQTEDRSDDELMEEIMVHLKDIYSNDIPYPNKILRTRWQSNENSYGSYSYTAVGTKMKHFDDIAEEIEDKVFFAGEHTEIENFSTVHGAYMSGIREAEKIIRL